MSPFSKLSLTALSSFCIGAFSLNTASADSPTLGEIVRLDPQLDALLAPEARLEVLAGGFRWSEGPVWIPDQKAEQKGGGQIVFSDVPQNTIYSWKEGQRGTDIFLRPSGFTGTGEYSRESGSNGLTRDAQGRLIIAEHGDRRISAMTSSGGKLTLADHYEGKRFNSPNDVIVHSDGSVWFTDPPYGLPGGWDGPNRELDHCGVYRISPEGTVTLVVKDLTRPNGLAFSPDEKTLYVAQSDPQKPVIFSYKIQEDGTVTDEKVFWDAKPISDQGPGLPDGLKVDVKGNLWATGPGGVWIISPEGKNLGLIKTTVPTGNCAFGGPDGTTLYITADQWLTRIPTKVKGSDLRP